MNDIRSALAAAMHSQAGVARGNTVPIKSDSRNDKSIATRPEDGGRAEAGSSKLESGIRELPANWTTSDKDVFRALPEPTQDFILRQCRRIEADLANKSERLAAFHREYEPVAKMLEPFAGRLKELGLTPQSAIQRYIDIERRLAGGDGVAVIRALVDGYKVAPDQVIEALGSRLPEARPALLSRPEKIDRQPPLNVTQHAATLRHFESQLEQFKTAEDAAGSRLYPHYEDVEPDMAAMALAYRTRAQTIPPLEELYERAVWANPGLRRALAQQGSGITTADAEAKPKIPARRPASTSSIDESKRAITTQSARRSLRDEILAHAGGF
ncbi:MAG: hypothetical protein JO134_03535 [Xanthobacteraceae bacterium]|nr:hypothetical protein [Xanthobacteraceae bacterium]MBV9627249.1 hypothetical protein [Xanthobacteraceae bacterium]